MSYQDNIISRFITIKTCQGYAFLNPDEVIRLQAEGNYTKVFVKDSDKPLRSLCQLSKMGKQLNYPGFFRCHRSHMINLNHLEGFMEKSRMLVLKGDHQVPISEYYLKDFRKMLG